MDTVLQTLDLSKAYGTRVAVDHLNLAVERGEIFGFLGPNGAGKTTTIRMALGLIAPTSGRVAVLGHDVSRQGADVLPRVGALVESPALYAYMSGRDNLRAFAAPLGGLSPRRLDEVLETVGLTGRQRDRVATYSLGMKQRLGVAAALLYDPDLLILDEPANGLDPAGIVEMRDLLRRQAREGKTVFISSHVLAEVQQICDRVAIINQGRLVRQAPVAALLASHGEFTILLDRADDALRLLRTQPWGRTARTRAGGLITPSPSGRGRELVQFLVQNGFWPDSLAPRQQTLEEIFLELTGGAN
ncbi:MAG TPA: ABC transporter ATP-binding protein [Candidatus Limnocylindrales bacterium]|nr:ABC transporter ATP-binding protein [Candidatus Limnocylindrales bacterium]